MAHDKQLGQVRAQGLQGNSGGHELWKLRMAALGLERGGEPATPQARIRLWNQYVGHGKLYLDFLPPWTWGNGETNFPDQSRPTSTLTDYQSGS